MKHETILNLSDLRANEQQIALGVIDVEESVYLKIVQAYKTLPLDPTNNQVNTFATTISQLAWRAMLSRGRLPPVRVAMVDGIPIVTKALGKILRERYNLEVLVPMWVGAYRNKQIGWSKGS